MKRQNQESLFEEILQRNRGRFAGIAHAYANGSDADDLLQEILLQVWRGLSGVKQNSSIDTWCYRVAINTALTWRRAAGRKRSNVPLDNSCVKGISGAADGHDLSKLLAKFLRSLARADRAMVLMYLDDFTGQEMAEVTGLSEGAVRVRIHRIKQRLVDWSATDE